MTKKDYERIAAYMQESAPFPCPLTDERVAQWHTDIEVLCRAFQGDNASFDRERFIRACQPGANVRARS